MTQEIQLSAFAEWRRQTLEKAQTITDRIRKQKQEFTQALCEAQQEILAVKAIRFVTLACQGFFKAWLGYEPQLNVTEEEIFSQ